MRRTVRLLSGAAVALTCTPSYGWADAASFSRLESVSAWASNDVWAAGTHIEPIPHHGQKQLGVLEHWDGQAWTLEGSFYHNVTDVTGVAAVGADAEAAVGNIYGSKPVPFSDYEDFENGNAKEGFELPLPPGVSTGEVMAISGTRLRDTWAVGSAGRSPQALVDRIQRVRPGWIA